MKRSTILTAVFTLLFGAIAISGCQTNATASTSSGGKQQDCRDNCQEFCQDNCSNFEFNGKFYDCTNPEGCMQCGVDFGFFFCSECTTSIANDIKEGNCSVSSPGFINVYRLTENVHYTIEYNGLSAKITLLKDVEHPDIILALKEKATNETVDTYSWDTSYTYKAGETFEHSFTVPDATADAYYITLERIMAHPL